MLLLPLIILFFLLQFSQYPTHTSPTFQNLKYSVTIINGRRITNTLISFKSQMKGVSFPLSFGLVCHSLNLRVVFVIHHQFVLKRSSIILGYIEMEQFFLHFTLNGHFKWSLFHDYKFYFFESNSIQMVVSRGNPYIVRFVIFNLKHKIDPFQVERLNLYTKYALFYIYDLYIHLSLLSGTSITLEYKK